MAEQKAGGKQCSFEGCEVIIEDTWEQRASKKGEFVYWIDTAVKGQPFVHRHNLDFGGDVRSGKGNGKVDTSELSKAVLGELKTLNATSAQVEIAKQLLRLATDKGSAAVGALDRLSVRLGDNFTARKPGPREKCSVCGRNASGDIVITISPESELEQRRLQQELEDEIAEDKLRGRKN